MARREAILAQLNEAKVATLDELHSTNKDITRRSLGALLNDLVHSGYAKRISPAKYAATEPPPPKLVAPIPDPADSPLVATGTQLAISISPYAGCSTNMAFGLVISERKMRKDNVRRFTVGLVHTEHTSTTTTACAIHIHTPLWDKPTHTVEMQLEPPDDRFYPNGYLHITAFKYATTTITAYDPAYEYTSISDFGD